MGGRSGRSFTPEREKVLWYYHVAIMTCGKR